MTQDINYLFYLLKLYSIEKGFIRARTIAYQDYIAFNGEDGAKNAGILAARIIGSADESVAKRVEAQLATISDEAKAKGAQLNARRNNKAGF